MPWRFSAEGVKLIESVDACTEHRERVSHIEAERWEPSCDKLCHDGDDQLPHSLLINRERSLMTEKLISTTSLELIGIVDYVQLSVGLCYSFVTELTSCLYIYYISLHPCG